MLTTKERIERELSCIDYLFKRIDTTLDEGNYDQALSYLNSMKYSIEELKKLENLKKQEEKLEKLFRQGGVQIHHLIHITSTKK